MRDSSETDAATSAEWGASDALLLEGLSGLDQRLAKPEASPLEEPVAERPEDRGPFAVAGKTGFRSARELRAAQERVAAQQRSAARRREGVTQALGLSEAPKSWQPDHQPTPAPQADHGRLGSTPPTEGSVSSQLRSLREEASTPSVRALSPASKANPRRPSEVSSESAPEERADFRKPDAAPQRERVLLEPRSVKELGAAEVAKASEVEGRHITPSMEPIVKRRRKSSSFLPSVLTSFLLTTLMWGAVLFTAWKFVGEEWFANRMQEAVSAEGGVGSELQLTLERLEQDVRNLEATMAQFRANHQEFVRMNALVASLWADNSRQKYDDLIEIGERLETGSPEKEFYVKTKVRIEQAYIKRIALHPGLDTAKYFPGSGQRSDKRVGREALGRLINDQTRPGWDRARAAYLLRNYKSSANEVIAQLLQTIRDDEDLQVYCAAWDSLVFLTDYKVGSKGISPDDFDRWYSTSRG